MHVIHFMLNNHPFMNKPTLYIALQLLDTWVVYIFSYYEQYFNILIHAFWARSARGSLFVNFKITK